MDIYKISGHFSQCIEDYTWWIYNERNRNRQYLPTQQLLLDMCFMLFITVYPEFVKHCDRNPQAIRMDNMLAHFQVITHPPLATGSLVGLDAFIQAF